jgi:L-rhamnose-H+ transport protein
MSALLGISSAVLSGGCDGSYGAVMKVTKAWEWENIWMVFSVTALAVFPLALALWSVPDLFGVYSQTSFGVVVATFLLGAGWGVGSVFFGLGLYMLGQSFAYTVMMGIIAVGGSLIPMLVTNPASAVTAGGLIILLSMLVTIAGVALCGIAGKIRDAGPQSDTHPAKRYHSFNLAFLVCLGGGIFSCMFNLAFHFAEPIAQIAAAQVGEASTSFKANSPIWALAMIGGFIPNFLYCLYLLLRKKTWKKFLQPRIGAYWLWGTLMGAIFAAGVTCYGIGASNLGKLGTTVAWLVFIAAGILTANFWGVITGEWQNAPSPARRHMAWGSAILFLSILLVNYGNYLLP